MDIGKYISEIIDSQGREKKWVAEQIEVQYRTFLYRLDNNCLLAEDLVKLGLILGIDLNKIKERVEE
jgi:hypothetical protein